MPSIVLHSLRIPMRAPNGNTEMVVVSLAHLTLGGIGKGRWQGSLAKVVGKGRWQRSLARVVGKGRWQGLLAKVAGKGCWQRSLARVVGKGHWQGLSARIAHNRCWQRDRDQNRPSALRFCRYLAFSSGSRLLKANGKHSAKTFAVKETSFGKGESIEISKRVPFRPVTTRTLYPGTHYAQLFVNGTSRQKRPFELVE